MVACPANAPTLILFARDEEQYMLEDEDQLPT